MNLNKEPYYKVYIRLSESILFDAALKEAEIDFIKEEKFLGEYIRYYFKDEDSLKVDAINTSLELSISTETIPALDYEIAKKYWIVFFTISLIVAALIWFLMLF